MENSAGECAGVSGVGLVRRIVGGRGSQRNGQGTFTFANGTVRKGIWLKGAFIVANDIPPKCFESDYQDCE